MHVLAQRQMRERRLDMKFLQPSGELEEVIKVDGIASIVIDFVEDRFERFVRDGFVPESREGVLKVFSRDAAVLVLRE